MDLCLIRSGNKETVVQAWDHTDWLRFRFSRAIRNRSYCKGTLISKKIMYPRSFSLWRFLRLVTDRISEKFFFVLWYVDCDRIYVPVSFQLWRLTNWLLVRYLRDLCLIRFGNKKAFEKLCVNFSILQMYSKEKLLLRYVIFSRTMYPTFIIALTDNKIS